MHIENYLRPYRRRTGLSTAQVGALLGLGSGTMITRYEYSRAIPTLEIVFAYEAVLGVSARDLFYGLFEQSHSAVIERAQPLLIQIEREKSSPFIPQRIQTLKRILNDH